MRSIRLIGIIGVLSIGSVLWAKSMRYASPSVCKEQIECAAKSAGTVELWQHNFDSGTYRIKQPGYYKLMGDIEFQPIPALEATRKDKPDLGWVAALTIETDFVVIDLNGHSIKASQQYLNQHFANVFADIELDNNPFPATLFFVIPSFFKGDTGSLYANNFVIKNGYLGRSSHWGIHGNNNSNFVIENLTIDDFEVAAIQINGQKNGKIRNIDIGGLRHTITARSTQTGAIIALQALKEINTANPNPTVQALLAQTLSLVLGGSLNQPIQYPDGSYFGLYINGGLAQAPADITLETCVSGAAASQSSGTYDIDIHNVKIHDLIGAPIETVSIGGIGGAQINTGAFQLFGVLRWQDAFNGAGNFAPQPLLQAQVYIMLALATANPALIATLPAPLNNPAPIAPFSLPAFQTWAFNILAGLPAISLPNPDPALFYPFVQPLFGTNFNFPFFNAGVFGLRLACSNNINVHNVSIDNIQNVGVSGATLETIPGGDYYLTQTQNPPVVQTRYAGNDVWGIEYAVTENICTSCVAVSRIFSPNGESFGIDVRNNSRNCCFKRCLVNDVSGKAACSDSVVNPGATVYGFIIGPSCSNITAQHVCVQNLIGACDVFGFAVESSFETVLKECRAYNLIANSLNGNLPKTVFGFASEGSQKTLFKDCTASKIVALSAPDVLPSVKPIAAGFAFVEDDNGNVDEHGKIVDSKACGYVANNGVARSMYLTNARRVTIKK
jgi:hypothetical protein